MKLWMRLNGTRIQAAEYANALRNLVVGHLFHDHKHCIAAVRCEAWEEARSWAPAATWIVCYVRTLQ